MGRKGTAHPAPLALSRSCLGLILTFPGVPMASVPAKTRNPAAAPSPTAASTAAPTTPALFFPHPHPPRSKGSLRRDPPGRPALPNKSLFHQVPFRRMRFRQWVGGVGWGRFLLPPASSLSTLRPWQTPTGTPDARLYCGSTHPSHTLSPPTFAQCFSALPSPCLSSSGVV